MTTSNARLGTVTKNVRSGRRIVMPRWAAEVGFVAAFYVAYETLRAVRHPSASLALSRGRAIAQAESWMHIGLERAVNDFVAAHQLLADGCGYYYATLHFTVTPLMLAWLWRRHRAAYSMWRTTLSIATAVGLFTYWLLPVAPPRLALSGMSDTLVARNIFGAGNPHGVTGLVNAYAAMPSLHVGWAFWVALAATGASTSRLRWLAWVYPAMTTLVVVATANHFIVDAVAGVAAVLVAAAITRPAARGRARVSAARLAAEWSSVQVPQLVGVGNEVNRHDSPVDDSEPDDPDRLATRCEDCASLSVDDGGGGVGCESRRRLQHALGDGLRADDRECGSGHHTGVGTEDDVRVEQSQQPLHVAGPGGCQERLHGPPLAS